MDRFRIDWNNLPKLWSRPRPKNDDYLLLVRCRKGPKNHSVNREKSYADHAAAARAKRENETKLAGHRAFKAQVAAYWRGERDSHP
jgi:hypothetical protein